MRCGEPVECVLLRKNVFSPLDEWKTNPFMRCGEPSMLAYTGETDAVKSLAVVRARKSAWRP